MNDFTGAVYEKLPVEWEVIPLETAVTVHDRKRIPLSSTQRANMQGRYPYCGANGIIDHINDYIFDGEFVLLAEDGGYWGPYENSAYTMNGKFWVNNHAHIIQAISSVSNNHFLMYALNFLNISLYISGTTRGKLNQGVMRRIPIPLPPLPEQRAIAHVLTTVRQSIEATERVIAAARDLKRSLMKHLFTYGPVPVSEAENVPLKETEIGEVPEGWDTIPLGDLCDFRTGKLDSNQAVPGGRYPFFTCARETFQIDNYSFDQEAILLAGNNAQGIYSVKHFRGKFDAYQRTYVISISDKQKLEYRYLLYDLSRKLNELRDRSLGTVTKFLTAKIIRSLVLTIPPKDIQNDIVGLLDSLEEKIVTEEQQKSALEALFNSLLHHLMTGKIRVQPFVIADNERDV